EVAKLGNIEIQNDRADIRVFVPEKSSFQLEAQARNGEIESDFNDIKIDNGDNRSTANGTVNGGSSHIVLNNEHGSIEIRKGEVVAQEPPASPAHKTPRSPKTSDVPDTTEN